LRSKKLITRLNRITEALEARGIGSFCDCPNSDGIRAKQIIAARLFPEIEYVEDPEETCDSHKPRPLRNPNVELGDTLLRLFPVFPQAIQEESGNRSFAELFISLPLETRMERFFGGNGESKRLKPSIFDRLEYRPQ